MNEQKYTVVVLTKEVSTCDVLQDELRDFTVIKTESVEAIHNLAKSGKTVGAFVLQITDSSDWIAFEFVRTAYPSVPCFVILEREESFKESKDAAMQRGAMAVVESTKPAALSALIIGSANNNLRKSEDLDKNADFLRTLGDLSRELSRLQEEFTETMLRTLPQPVIGIDTRHRLTRELEKLQEIRITP